MAEEMQKDSGKWIETCDFKGWNNPIVKQNHIQDIPDNILINNSRKIVATHLPDETLYEKINELIKE